MVEHTVSSDGLSANLAKNVKVEEDEEEFRSCCEDENELREREELVKVGPEVNDFDEHSVKLYFKGVSVVGPGESSYGFSGIGVVMESSTGIQETFTLDVVPAINLQAAVGLAHVAIGVVSLPPEGNVSTQSCFICCDEKPSSMMMKLKCSHRFCSHCMKKYVEGKIKSTQVPVRCPQLKCKYYLSTTECKAFLPVISYASLEKALADSNIVNSDSIYCPYPSCSVLLDLHEYSSFNVGVY